MRRVISGAALIASITVGLAGCGVVLDSGIGTKVEPGEVFEGPVARAACGPDDLAEPGLQGRFAMADRIASAETQLPFNCNLELVGHVQGTGAAFQDAWYGDCAYFATGQQIYRGLGALPGTVPASSTNPAYPGTTVVDASDPAAPMISAYLTTPALAYPHEAIKVHEGRALLGALQAGGNDFELYDVSVDCAHPRLASSATMPAAYVGHEGDFAADGRTYYGASTSPLDDGGVSAIDVTDPANPAPVAHAVLGTDRVHGLSTRTDGTRGYFTLATGLTIVDLTAIQRRAPAPSMVEIGRVVWVDGGGSQHTIPVTIKGKPYVIAVDELGTPPGAQRIIDVSDDKNPFEVSKLKLEIQMASPEAQAATEDDCTDQLFCYHSHYCGVDRPVDPTVLGCSQFNSGIRVYDIRDPLNPKEIAYFVPPSQAGREALLPASGHFGSKSADWCAANVRFVPERGEIWTTCMDYGFMVLKFTNGVWPFTE